MFYTSDMSYPSEFVTPSGGLAIWLAYREPDDLDLVLQSDALINTFAARRFRRIEVMRQAALADPRRVDHNSPDIIERSLRLELAAAMRITETRAAALMAQADSLVNRYPSVLDALRVSKVTEAHAAILSDALDAVEPEFREELLPQALELAQAEPVGKFRRKLRLLIDMARVVTLETRHREAMQRRRFSVQVDDDGMAWSMLYGPAVEAQAEYKRLTEMAKRIAAHPDETRTIDQIRADIAGDLLIEGTTDAIAPEARGIRATVAVTVPVLALLEGEGAGECADRVAVVEGVGPIPIARARELCGGADGWMRVLTHPETGMVLSVGRDQYRPPPGLKRLVRFRSGTCMAPGCNRPASQCEIDHTVAWEDGGETSLDNLANVCKNHHILKHHGDWMLEQVPGSGGVMAWTSPTGRVYLVAPERRIVAFVPDGDVAPF